MKFLGFFNWVILALMIFFLGLFMAPSLMTAQSHLFSWGSRSALILFGMVGMGLFLSSFRKVVQLYTDCSWICDLVNGERSLAGFFQSYRKGFLENLHKSLEKSNPDHPTLSLGQWSKIEQGFLKRTQEFKSAFQHQRVLIIVVGILCILDLFAYQMTCLETFNKSLGFINEAPSLEARIKPYLENLLSFATKSPPVLVKQGVFIANVIFLTLSFFTLFLLLENQWQRIQGKIHWFLENKKPLWVLDHPQPDKPQSNLPGSPLFWESLISLLAENFEKTTYFLKNQEEKNQELRDSLIFLSEKVHKVNEMMKIEHSFLEKIGQAYEINSQTLQKFSDVLEKTSHGWNENIGAHIRNIDFSLERILKDGSNQRDDLKETLKQEMRMVEKILSHFLKEA